MGHPVVQRDDENNTLAGNVGRRNGEFDAYDEDTPMLNTWTNNKFAKTSPKGL